MTDQTPDPNRHGATPLGGRVKDPRRVAIARQWSGYVAMIRTCPVCSTENVERNLFCSQCGGPLATIQPQPADSDAAGRDLLRYRLASEQRVARRTRIQYPQGGTGLVLLGVIFLAVGSWISADIAWQAAIWVIGMSLAIAGLWKMRTDSMALRNWGIILSVGVVGLLALFVNNSVAESDPTSPVPTAVATDQIDIAVTAATPGDSFSGAVPVYRGDNGHTGVQPGPTITESPELAWRFDTGGQIYSSPIVADSRLFVASKSGILFALDAATGAELWQFQLSDYVVRSTPAVVDSTLYIGAGFNLFAIDAATGQERWRFPMRYAGQSSPVVVGNGVLLTSQEGWVYNVDRTTGEMLWRLSTEGLPFGSIAANETIAIVATETGIIHCITIETGRPCWRKDIADGVFATPVITKDAAILVTRSGVTYSMSLSDGSTRWTASVGGMESVATNGTTSYVSGSDGAISSISMIDGQTGWVYPTGRTNAAAPVLSGNLVIAGSGRNLVALDAASGTQIWNYLAGGEIGTSPAVIGGYLFFGSEDGFVYALKAPTDEP
ncbi:MAG: PQQ-binding-like beta-propeller repeat protein [Thermomicrobiales bacterium]